MRQLTLNLEAEAILPAGFTNSDEHFELKQSRLLASRLSSETQLKKRSDVIDAPLAVRRGFVETNYIKAVDVRLANIKRVRYAQMAARAPK